MAWSRVYLTGSKDSAVAEHSSVVEHTDWGPEGLAGLFQASLRLLNGLEALLMGRTVRVHNDYLVVGQMVAHCTAKFHEERSAAAEQVRGPTTAAAVRMRLRQSKKAFRAVEMIVTRA